MRNDSGTRCRRSSREIKLHVPVGHGVQQLLISFQVLTSDSGYLYACRFKLHGADACVSGAVDRHQVAISKLRAKGSNKRPAAFALGTPSNFPPVCEKPSVMWVNKTPRTRIVNSTADPLTSEVRAERRQLVTPVL
ncbi:hypothetical protein EVAR_88520_1 [Eumeta japonica]|uniref:Uncharacterized protein n=1 Tax=Eumeta variegata TaxID=151549 RepID=A0A4C1WNY4_EUMVA|nr:hypothetical protein EVAR_88520_1 [Eumeta japonica]